MVRSVVYGEADRIVTLLTESRGKVAVFARNARKSARRFGAALEPYALIEAEIALGKGDVGRILNARVVRAFPGILADLERMSVAAAGVELLREAIAEREPDARFLPTIERFFELAAESARDELLVSFGVRVLSLVGLGPNVETCGHCGRSAPQGKAALFDPALGALVCRRCGGAPIKLSGPLRARLVRASTRRWDEEAAAQWTENERATGRHAWDEVVRRHLPHRLSGGELVAQVREVQLGYAARGKPT